MIRTRRRPLVAVAPLALVCLVATAGTVSARSASALPVPTTEDPEYLECVRERRAEGDSREEAVEYCRDLADVATDLPEITTDPVDDPTITTAEPDEPDEPAEVDDPTTTEGADDPEGPSDDPVEEEPDDAVLLTTDDDTDGVPIAAVVAAAVVFLMLGLAIGALVGRRKAAQPLPTPLAGGAMIPATAPQVVAPVAVPVTENRAAEDRRVLVATLVELADQMPSDALKEQIHAQLLQVGVQEVVVQRGEPFDPQRHRGIDTFPSPEPGMDQKVAHTERCGYTDGGTVLRVPEVVVYRDDPSA